MSSSSLSGASIADRRRRWNGGTDETGAGTEERRGSGSVMHGEEQIGAVFYNAPLAAGAPRGSRPWKPRALTDENGGSGSPVVECLPEKGAAGFAAVSCSVKSRWTGSRRRDLASRSGFACVRFALLCKTVICTLRASSWSTVTFSCFSFSVLSGTQQRSSGSATGLVEGAGISIFMV
jgi:hypothetical protein